MFRSFIIAFVLSFAFFGVIYGLGMVSLQSKTADARSAVTFETSNSRIDISWFGDEYYIDYSFLPEYETMRPRLLSALYISSPPSVKFTNSAMFLGSAVTAEMEFEFPEDIPFLKQIPFLDKLNLNFD